MYYLNGAMVTNCFKQTTTWDYYWKGGCNWKGAYHKCHTIIILGGKRPKIATVDSNFCLILGGRGVGLFSVDPKLFLSFLSLYLPLKDRYF